jgi:hypothetical protein
VAAGQARQVLASAQGGAHGATESVLGMAAVSGAQATFLVCGLTGLLAGGLVLALHRPVLVGAIAALPEAAEEPAT